MTQPKKGLFIKWFELRYEHGNRVPGVVADYLCKKLKERLGFAGQLRIRSKEEGAGKKSKP